MIVVIVFYNKIISRLGLSKNTVLQNTALLFFALSPVLLIVSRAAADAALGIVSLLFLLHCFLHKSWAWVKDPYLLGFLVLWLWLFIVSVFAVVDSGGSFSRALAWGRFIPLVFAAKYWLLIKNDNKKIVWWCLFLTLSYVLVDVLCQRLIGVSIEGHKLASFRRLTGPFTDEVVGTYMAKLGLLCLGGGVAFFEYRKTIPKWFMIVIWIAIVVFMLTVLLSGERIAFLSLGLGLGIFIMCMHEYRKSFVILGGVCAVTLAISAVNIPATRSRMIQQTANQIEAFETSHYGMIFGNALRMVKENPITGVGLKNYRSVCKDDSYRRPIKAKPSSCGLHPHNAYLEWAAEAGLVGLSLFVGLMGWIIGSAVKTARQCVGAEYYMVLGALAALIPFLWPIMSSMSLFTNWNAVLFWFIMAWVFSYSEKKSA